MREEGARELAGEDEDTIIAAMAERPELQRPFVVNGERGLARPAVERGARGHLTRDDQLSLPVSPGRAPV